MELNAVAEFSEELRVFLLNMGYYYVWHEGLSDEHTEEDEFASINYYLNLLSNDDERTKTETDLLTHLDSTDVLDMTVVGADPIKFILRLPEELYLNYLTN